MALLGVNVDHVATLRQARGGAFPDPVEAALECQHSGADSIVVHLREDRRHIQDKDVLRLREKLMIRLNLEMSTDRSVVETALKARPDTVTFVPERRQERTTESGLDVEGEAKRLSPVIEEMKKRVIIVSLFVNPREAAIRRAKELGADAVEIHTGEYAHAATERARELRLREIEKAVHLSNEIGLKTHVGHGLDYANVGEVARIPGILEFNIGFSIIARALVVGLSRAVAEMKEKIS